MRKLRLMTAAFLAVGALAAAAPAAAAGVQYQGSCFGYTGTFRNINDPAHIDWYSDLEECFGIGTDRRIWHTWPGAGGWHLMPGNGRADEIGLLVEDPGTGQRWVHVTVYGSGDWYQTYRRGSGWSGVWTKS